MKRRAAWLVVAAVVCLLALGGLAHVAAGGGTQPLTRSVPVTQVGFERSSGSHGFDPVLRLATVVTGGQRTEWHYRIVSSTRVKDAEAAFAIAAARGQNPTWSMTGTDDYVAASPNGLQGWTPISSTITSFTVTEVVHAGTTSTVSVTGQSGGSSLGAPFTFANAVDADDWAALLSAARNGSNVSIDLSQDPPMLRATIGDRCTISHEPPQP